MNNQITESNNKYNICLIIIFQSYKRVTASSFLDTRYLESNKPTILIFT